MFSQIMQRSNKVSWPLHYDVLNEIRNYFLHMPLFSSSLLLNANSKSVPSNDCSLLWKFWKNVIIEFSQQQQSGVRSFPLFVLSLYINFSSDR